MKCIKCGRETVNDRTFCEECLEIMEQYPVKPGTPIHIPRRKIYEDSKPVRRKKTASPEEQLQEMQNKVKWLSAAVVVLLATTVLLGLFLLKDLLIPKEEPEITQPRNYIVTRDAEER